jgi:hypothetical protein
MNVMQERPLSTFALPSLPAPNANMSNCTHNVGEVFAASISRPDLGDIDGDIEPSQVHYTIKGIGNMFGAMFINLLINHPANVAKPAIYSYHQPCDIIVTQLPILQLFTEAKQSVTGIIKGILATTFKTISLRTIFQINLLSYREVV